MITMPDFEQWARNISYEVVVDAETNVELYIYHHKDVEEALRQAFYQGTALMRRE